MNSWLRPPFLTLLLSILSVQAQQTPNHSCISLDGAIQNGYVTFQPIKPGENPLVHFECNPPYGLGGEWMSECENGRWTKDLPVCFSRGGCPVLSLDPHRHDFVSDLFRLIYVHCDPGYSLRFKPENETHQLTPRDREIIENEHNIGLYCISGAWNFLRQPNSEKIINDPSKWNTLMPVSSEIGCEIANTTSETSYRCDYEDSVCGWIHDRYAWRRYDEWDWTQSIPGQILGVNQTGRFLYINGTARRSSGEKARFYSPVFHQDLTGVTQACFRFNYHMFGPKVVALRVFVLERGQVFSELKPKVELIGEQGNEWRLAEVQLKPCDNCSQLTPFQIVLEGQIRGGNQSDIAFDNVHLMMGQECEGGNIINAEKRRKRRYVPIAPVSPAETECRLPNCLPPAESSKEQ